MKKLFLLLVTALCIMSANAQKYVGGDVSLLKAYEDKGAPYFDQDGNKIESLLPYLKSTCGMNTMRVRLFHDPDNAPAEEKKQGVFQDLNYVKALGKEIKDAGLDFMLDFHYSDTWADPDDQWTPKAWLNLSDADLQDSIYNYTKNSLLALANAGATPDFIQIGNEISYGMCWGAKGVGSPKSYYAGQSKNRDYFTGLLKSASKACREVCPNAKIIIHTERVADYGYIIDFYRDMDNAGVDYDIIGTSYYSYYHGLFSKLEEAITHIERNFNKDIMLVETAYYYQWQPTDGSVKYDYSNDYPNTPEGQAKYAKALIELLNKHPRVKGLFWWDMDANDTGAWLTDDWSDRVTSGWYNAGLVNENNSNLLPAAYVLKDFLADPTGIHSLKVDKASTDDHFYNLQGQRVSKPHNGVFIHKGKKVVIK